MSDAGPHECLQAGFCALWLSRTIERTAPFQSFADLALNGLRFTAVIRQFFWDSSRHVALSDTVVNHCDQGFL